MTSVQYTQVYWSVNVYQILCISLSVNIKRKALQLLQFLARRSFTSMKIARCHPNISTGHTDNIVWYNIV
jgi:hypothetical protein